MVLALLREMRNTKEERTKRRKKEKEKNRREKKKRIEEKRDERDIRDEVSSQKTRPFRNLASGEHISQVSVSIF